MAEVDYAMSYCHRRTGQFFLGWVSHLCLKFFSTAPEKRLR